MPELFGAWEGVLAVFAMFEASCPWIKGYSSMVISWINSNHKTKIPNLPILHDIWKALQGLSYISVTYVYREDNQLADQLTRHSASLWFNSLGL